MMSHKFTEKSPDLMLFSSQAMDILNHTSDGDDLMPEDLSLLQAVVNSRGGCLSATGIAYWNNLYRMTLSGGYQNFHQHFCGVPGLTRSPDGFVAWRGAVVEHYSHRDHDAMVTDARVLGAICLAIEARGLPVTGSSVMSFYDDLRFGAGLVSPRISFVWTLEKSGPQQSVREIKSTDYKGAKAEAAAHLDELKQVWRAPAAVRSFDVFTQDDVSSLMGCFESDDRWARTHRWAPYESGAANAQLRQALHASVNCEALPTNGDFQKMLIGDILANVTQQSEQFLAEVKKQMTQKIARERVM
jgi:hypothetical protein